MEQILISEGLKLNDYIIRGNQAWKKDSAPLKYQLEEAENELLKAKADLDYVSIMTGVDLNV